MCIYVFLGSHSPMSSSGDHFFYFQFVLVIFHSSRGTWGRRDDSSVTFFPVPRFEVKMGSRLNSFVREGKSEATVFQGYWVSLNLSPVL